MIELKIKIEVDRQSRQRAIYVLNLLSSITGIRMRLSEDDPDIVYGESGGLGANLIPVFEGDLFRERRYDLHAESGVYLPREMIGPPFSLDERRLSFDLLAAIYGRLAVRLQSCKRYGRSDWSGGYQPPEFHRYAAFFCRWLTATGKLPTEFAIKSPWPNNAPFALGLSFDIDILRRRPLGGMKVIARSLYGRGLPGGLGGALAGFTDTLWSSLTGRQNPYHRFTRVLDESDGVTIFAFAGRRNDPRDPTYSLDELRKVLDAAGGRFEIALHNGIGSGGDPEQLAYAKSCLSEIFKCAVIGIRPHFLDCRFPEFWKNLGGFAYSSAVGSDTVAGFPAGVEFPFFGVDFQTAEAVDILELPIGLMDCALHRDNRPESAETLLDQVIDDCLKSHALLVLDWHNTSFYDKDYRGWSGTYAGLIERSRAAGAFIAPLGQIDSYWRNRCASLFLS